MSAIPIYLTSIQAAAIIGIDDSQVRRHCARGTLPAIRLGRRAWMILAEDARSFAAQTRRPGRRKNQDSIPTKVVKPQKRGRKSKKPSPETDAA